MTMRRLTIRTKIMIIVFVIISYNIIVRIQYLKTFINLDVYFNASCYTEPGDELPYVNDNFKPKEHSIFFLETSCTASLNSRQACTVEAAARRHPHWDVHVFFVSRIKDLNHKSLVALKKFSNVKLSRLNLEEYSTGTPLEELVTSGDWLNTMWKITLTSDLLRYLTLYKFSGIYLDLDSVVVKPLDDLVPNWTARESNWAVGAGAFSFSSDEVGRTVAEDCVRDLVKIWRAKFNHWGNTGPGVIYRVLSEMCDTQNVTDMKPENCKGFEVYDQSLFYPIAWRSAMQYLKPPTTTYPDIYAYHVWNHITQDEPVIRGSFYDLIAKEHCPDIYKTYGKDFGMEYLIEVGM